MTAEEQRLIDEAFVATRRVQRECQGGGLNSAMLSATESFGNMLALRATVPEQLAPVLHLVRP